MDEAAFTIFFVSGGNAGVFLRAGWSVPEPTHTWATGPQSALELPRPTVPGRYLLVLELTPFVSEDKLPAQQLTVIVNDQVVGEFEISGGTTAVECVVPWWLLVQRDRVEVVFHHPDAASPRSVNDTLDDRLLAFAFESLSFVYESASGENAERIPATSDDALPASAPLDQLLMRFESLGENSEFGLIQRYFGAKQSGLLSLASAPAPALVAGLHGRFAGIGDPDQIDLRMPDKRRKCLLVDNRFGFTYRPSAKASDGEDAVRAREAQKLSALRSTLVEDLQRASKIFVYRPIGRLGEPVMRRLVTALRAYGPTTLLWVEMHDQLHQPGTVEALGPGLLKGYINASASDETPQPQLLDCWSRICREAYRMVHTGPGEA